MQQIALSLTQLLLDNEVIHTKQQEIYAYGIQLILMAGMTSTVLLGIGMITQEMPLTLIFMVTLMSLRHYTGGFHASAYWKCFCISCICYLGMLIVVHLATRFLGTGIALCGSWLFSGYLVYKGSLNSIRNPKTKEEMQQRKRMTRYLSLLYSVVIFLLTVEELWLEVIWLIVYVQFITVIGVKLGEKIKGDVEL